MTNERKTPQIILTVLLVGGVETNHMYDVPPDPKKATELVEQLADKIVTAMIHKKELPLHLRNPSITYNPDNVLGVKWDFFKTEEIEKAIEKARRKMGYLKD